MNERKKPSKQSLRDFFDVLFRRKVLIAVFFFTTVLLCVAGILFKSPEYRSIARVMIKQGRENAGIDSSIVAATTVVSPSTERREEILSELAILRSRTLAEHVVANLGAERFESEFSWIGNAVRLLDDIIRKNVLTDNERAILLVEKHLRVGQVAESNVVEIAFTARSRDLARDVVDRLLTGYRDLHIDVHRKIARMPAAPQEPSARSMSALYRQLVHKRRRNLEVAENKLQALKTKGGVSDLDTQIRAAIGQITALQDRVDGLNAEIAKTDAQIAQTGKKLAELPKQIPLEKRLVRNEQIRRLEDELLTLQLDQARLLTLYKPDSRQVADVRLRIKQAKEAIASAQRKTFDSETSGINQNHLALERAKLFAETEKAGLSKQVEWLQKALDARNKKLVALSQKEKDLDAHTRQADESKSLLDFAVNKLNQSSIEKTQEDAKVSNLAVVQSASMPLQPITPRPTLFVFLSVLVAGFLSLVAAFVVDYFDHALHNEWEAEELLGVPVLGSVPEGQGMARVLSGDTRPSTLYSKIGERLQHRPSKGPARIIQVTGAVHKEGVSTMALNLATALTRRDAARVLLVDANLRRPVLHHVLNGSAGEVPSPLDLDLPQIPGVQIQTTPVANLFVVLNTRDTLEFEPRTLFASESFEQFLRAAAEKFDFILLDSAPVNPYFDAAALAMVADATVLVVRAGKTRWEVVRSAVEGLRTAGRAPDGLILNRRVYAIPEFVYSRL